MRIIPEQPTLGNSLVLGIAWQDAGIEGPVVWSVLEIPIHMANPREKHNTITAQHSSTQHLLEHLYLKVVNDPFKLIIEVRGDQVCSFARAQQKQLLGTKKTYPHLH